MVSKLRNVISKLFDGQDVMIGLNESLIDEKERRQFHKLPLS